MASIFKFQRRILKIPHHHRTAILCCLQGGPMNSHCTAGVSDTPRGPHSRVQDDQSFRDARSVFDQAVSSVLPHRMISDKLKFHSRHSMLEVEGREYKLKHNVYVVGFGKAVLGMARALEDVVGEHVVKGVVSIPTGSQDTLRQAGKQEMLLTPDSKIHAIEGAANNLPDQGALAAAGEIQQLAVGRSHDDILIVLVSGGGSALLPFPGPPVTLDDMLTLTRQLSRAGASIVNLNTVRKQLELLKGGGLAQLAQPAQVISLILSDVIGDPLDFIASGPTVPDQSTPQDCLDLFSSLGILDSVPESALALLNRKMGLKQKVDVGQDTNDGLPAKASVSTPPGNRTMDWSTVHNVLVGTNKIACQNAVDKSTSLGYLPFVLSTQLDGEARLVGKMFAALAHYVALLYFPDSASQEERDSVFNGCDSGISRDKLLELQHFVVKARNEKKNMCIIAGGETTVTVQGQGKGGRNQEMALACALELHHRFMENNSSGNSVSESNPVHGESASAGKPSSPESASYPVPVSVQFLSAGTDGQDGPTTAAGGVVGVDYVHSVQQAGLDVQDYLDRNDSHSLLALVKEGSGLVVTGLTGTNVMDIQVLLLRMG